MVRPRGVVSKRDGLLFLIQMGPGRTQQQLVDAIYGPGAPKNHISYECLSLVNSGRFSGEAAG